MILYTILREEVKSWVEPRQTRVLKVQLLKLYKCCTVEHQYLMNGLETVVMVYIALITTLF